MATTDDRETNEEINRLLNQAASTFNGGFRCPIRCSFDQNDRSFLSVKKSLTPKKLFEYLERFQCQSDLGVDDNYQETYEKCSRLGLVFVPQNKEGFEKYDAAYDGQDDLNYERVKKECIPCFNTRLQDSEENYADYWFGKEAENYFGLPGLCRVIDTGRVPNWSMPFNGRGGCLEPDRFHTGNHALLCGNLTTVASAFVVDGDIWKIYWSLIKKHCLTKEQVEEIEKNMEDEDETTSEDDEDEDDEEEEEEEKKPSATATTRRIIKARRPVRG